MITVLLFNNSTSQLKTIDLQAVLHCPDSHLYYLYITYPGTNHVYRNPGKILNFETETEKSHLFE